MLFGEATILLAIPLAAVIATLFDVLVLHRDPGDQERAGGALPAQEGRRGVG